MNLQLEKLEENLIEKIREELSPIIESIDDLRGDVKKIKKTLKYLQGEFLTEIEEFIATELDSVISKVYAYIEDIGKENQQTIIDEADRIIEELQEAVDFVLDELEIDEIWDKEEEVEDGSRS